MRGDIMKIVFGTIAIAVAFIIFPMVIEGAESTRLAANLASYTGMTSMIGIGPTLAFVVLILGGLFSTGVGVYHIARSGRKRSRR